MILPRQGDPTLEDPRRTIGFERIPNFRDLGGYATADGGRIRWGMLYRSAKLSGMTPRDQERLRQLGVCAVIDLRTREERDLEPSAWATRPDHLFESPRAGTASLARSMRARATSAASGEALMIERYARRPVAFATEFRAMFEMLAAGRAPMLIHCTAGKDRTGTAAALLLTALGVPRVTVVADYVMTSRVLSKDELRGPLPIGVQPDMSEQVAGISPEALAAIWASKPDYIEATLDAVDTGFGSIHGYLRDGLHLPETQISALEYLVER